MHRPRPGRYLVLTLLALASAAPVLAQPTSRATGDTPYFPPADPIWERRAPAGVGMSQAAIDEAIAFANANESKMPRDLAVAHYLQWACEPYDAPLGPFRPRGEVTGLIIRHGYVVAEWGEPRRVDLTYSVTKSFLSSVVGLAVDRGLIRDVHDRVRDYVPTDHFDSPHNAKITWDHLLRQTSDWEGTLWGKPDWADRPQGEALEWMTRPRHEPGTVYKYNDVRVNLLALSALQVWRQPLPQVLRTHLMDPIGASNTWRWSGYENSWVELDGQKVQSVSGGAHWGGGLFISAFDQARFGLLTLRGGRWENRQILSNRWIELARTPTGPQPTYGVMNWFLNTDRKLLPSAPATAFYHAGAGANIIYVDPEHDLVVVVRWIDSQALDGLVSRVLAAITGASR